MIHFKEDNRNNIIKNMLSFSQIRIWLLQTYYKNQPIYNVSFDLNIEDNLDILLFDKSINIILKRNDILRTNIINRNGYPELKLNNLYFKTDILSYNEEEIYKNNAFDLENDLLLKVGKLNNKLFFCFSDIIIDGFSINNFLKELDFTYNCIYHKKLIKFNYTNSFYKYINDEKKKYNQEIEFWRGKLHKNLFTPFPLYEQNEESSTEDRIKYTIEGIQLEKLNLFINKKEITFFDLFLSAIFILIYKYTNKNYLCLDTILGTNQGAFDNKLIGLLNNTLLLPIDLNPEMNLDEYLNYIKILKKSYLENSNTELEKIVSHLKIDSLPNIRIHFEYSNKYYENGINLGDSRLSSDFIENSSNSIRQLIIFNFAINKHNLDCFISYKKKCFNIQNILELKNNLLDIINIYLDDNISSLNDILERIKIKTNFKFNYEYKLDKRLLAYQMAGEYPNVNYNNFKKKLDEILNFSSI